MTRRWYRQSIDAACVEWLVATDADSREFVQAGQGEVIGWPRRDHVEAANRARWSRQ